MTIKAMDFVERDDRVIWFEVDLHEPSRLEQLGFLVMLEMKYSADRRFVGRSQDMRQGIVELMFPSLDAFHDAKGDCRSKLSKDGRVSPGYRRALAFSDPKGKEARTLLTAIEAESVSN